MLLWVETSFYIYKPPGFYIYKLPSFYIYKPCKPRGRARGSHGSWRGSGPALTAARTGRCRLPKWAESGPVLKPPGEPSTSSSGRHSIALTGCARPIKGSPTSPESPRLCNARFAIDDQLLALRVEPHRVLEGLQLIPGQVVLGPLPYPGGLSDVGIAVRGRGIAVAVIPGATALTLMLWGPNSAAALRANCTSAALSLA